jgi:hypothetical protein
MRFTLPSDAVPPILAELPSALKTRGRSAYYGI